MPTQPHRTTPKATHTQLNEDKQHDYAARSQQQKRQARERGETSANQEPGPRVHSSWSGATSLSHRWKHPASDGQKTHSGTAIPWHPSCFVKEHRADFAPHAGSEIVQSGCVASHPPGLKKFHWSGLTGPPIGDRSRCILVLPHDKR